MSRKRKSEHHLAQIVYVECTQGHTVGMVVMQKAGPRWLRDGNPFMIGRPLERIDGPNGETKVLVVCPACEGTAQASRPPRHAPRTQIRWDRLQTMLETMEAGHEHERTIRAE